jgi:hypothetical protein
MKLLYHRQVLDLIRNNRGIPLTSTAAEIYGSYLLYVDPPRHRPSRVNSLYRCDYVSASTKSAIASDIFGRVYHEHEGLQVHSNIAHDLQLLEVFGTGDTWISLNIWWILDTLANRGASTALAATCGSLLALLL